MKEMMGGSYLENVRKTFLPEFISMNAMMAAMAPVMSFLMMGRDMRAMEPTELVFWGVMSIGVIAGFVLAYPFNVWMVEKRLKHGLMTERPRGSRFAREAKRTNEKAGVRQHGAEHHQHGGGSGRDMVGTPTAPQLAAMAGVTFFLLATGL